MPVFRLLLLLITASFKAIGKKPLPYFIACFSTQRGGICFYDGGNGKEWVISKNNMPGSISGNALTVRLGIHKLSVTVSPSGGTDRIREVEFRNQINDRDGCRER